jgi:hypothetical protein
VKRFLVALVVLLALAVAADRVAVTIASRTVAAEAQRTAGLEQPPEVRIGGFPFLTQALAGRYDEVRVRAADVPAGELRVAGFEAFLSGVEVPLGDALSGSVTSAPVRSVRAEATVAYDELTRRSGDRKLVVTPAGDGVRVTGSVRVLGQTLSATAVSRVEVVEGDLLVTAESYEVGNNTADALLSRALGERLDLRVPVEGLPYGLQLTGVEVGERGVTVLANAGATVLGRIPSASR